MWFKPDWIENVLAYQNPVEKFGKIRFKSDKTSIYIEN